MGAFGAHELAGTLQQAVNLPAVHRVNNLVQRPLDLAGEAGIAGFEILLGLVGQRRRHEFGIEQERRVKRNYRVGTKHILLIVM